MSKALYIVNFQHKSDVLFSRFHILIKELLLTNPACSILARKWSATAVSNRD